MNLNDLGWDDGFAAALEPYHNCIPARVSAQHRGEYDLLAEHGDLYEGVLSTRQSLGVALRRLQ